MTPILPTSFLPSVHWFSMLWNHSAAVLESCEHFQKGTMRNRCIIAGPNGVQRLSVPLAKGKHQQMPIRDVRIAYDEPWQRQHWRSIRTAYGNAPFFEHYMDDLAPFFERRFDFLFDLNLELLTFFLKKTGWPGELILSPQYTAPGKWSYGPDFRTRSADDAEDWPDNYVPTRYPQVFEEKHGFLPNLSILDLLLCCGKQSGDILTTQHS